MIGNDVVDLSDPETRPGATHPRFDRRVFSREELALLRQSGAPNRLRWILWAAKEAAYKAVRKLDPRAVFSPRRFQVRLEASLCGEVEHEGRRLGLRVRADDRCVHAIATAGDVPEERIVTALEALATGAAPADPSGAARALAVRALAARLGTAPEELEFWRQGRIPRLRLRGAESDLDLSLSHHGRFVALACDLARAAGPAGPPA